MRNALVAGAGVAGLTAAHALISRGVPVLLVEQRPVVGGWAATYGCKAGTDCTLCGVCLAAATSRRVNPNGMLALRTDTAVAGIEGEPGGFSVRLLRHGRGTDVARCTACGLCASECPVGAIRLPHPQALPLAFVLDADVCLRSAGETCTRCRDICPFDAVRLDPADSEETVQAGVVVLATGFTPFPASRKGQFGHGRLPGVMTTMELEQGLWEHGPDYLDRVVPGCRRVAVIHCVGSRDISVGRGWCSQVCCPTALRLAGRLVTGNPEINITLFFMDLQRCAPGIASLYAELPPSVHLIRGIPAEIKPAPNGLALAFEDVTLGERRREIFDAVVLAVGMDGPVPIEGVPAQAPDFLTDLPAGVVAAGTSGGPLSIPDAVADGLRAAASALTVLEALR